MEAAIPAGQDSQARLSILAEELATFFLVNTTAKGLLVRHHQQPTLADTITCRPHTDQPDQMWFYTSWQDPIAPADQVGMAVEKVKDYLKVRM